MRFPGAAGGASHIPLVQENREILETEIETIESVSRRELAPLLIGMPIDPLRRGRQVVGDQIDEKVELLVAAFADAGRATIVANGDDFAHNEIAFSNMPSRSAWSKAL